MKTPKLTLLFITIFIFYFARVEKKEPLLIQKQIPLLSALIIFPANLIDSYQYLMQINKALTAKEKKIQKRERAKMRRKNENLQNFSFQNELIDLVSQRSEKIIDEVEQNIDEIPQANPETIIEEKRNEHDNKNIKISDEEYYLIVEVGKFYKTRKENERNHCEISSLSSNDYFIINGLQHTIFSSANSFIFQAKRKNDAPIKFDQYITRISLQGQQKITKSMLNLKKQTLIRSSSKIQVEETTEPWANLPKCIQENDSLMLVGVKNTGKSTLAQYLLQSQGSDCVLLDCDIGRNSCLEGCVSLSSSCFESKKIWIGELTPLNNLQTYLRAIRYLFDFYNEKWFTKKLVVNTMGYLTGLGQFLLYEIYQIVKPKSVLALQANGGGERYQLSNILHNFKSGNYVNRLYISNGAERNQSPSSTAIYYYNNPHSLNKKSFSRFEKMFQGSNTQVRSIVDLINVIKQSSLLFNPNPQLISKERIGIDIYEQSRHGKEEMQGQQVVSYRKLNAEESVDMRLVILGKMIDQNQIKLVNSPTYQSSNLLEVSGLGFGFQGRIYYKQSSEGTIGIVNEGMDFEKGFYHLNEKQLIDLELRYGRLKFIMVTAKGLGSKGVRNNPSKVS